MKRHLRHFSTKGQEDALETLTKFELVVWFQSIKYFPDALDKELFSHNNDRKHDQELDTNLRPWNLYQKAHICNIEKIWSKPELWKQANHIICASRTKSVPSFQKCFQSFIKHVWNFLGFCCCCCSCSCVFFLFFFAA